MTTPIARRYYQHRYGGVYQVDIPCSKNTIDKSEWVVYTHVWPFPLETWHRPKAEWEEEGKFRELSPEELTELFNRKALDFQKEIIANKAASGKR